MEKALLCTEDFLHPVYVIYINSFNTVCFYKEGTISSTGTMLWKKAGVTFFVPFSFFWKYSVIQFLPSTTHSIGIIIIPTPSKTTWLTVYSWLLFPYHRRSSLDILLHRGLSLIKKCGTTNLTMTVIRLVCMWWFTYHVRAQPVVVCFRHTPGCDGWPKDIFIMHDTQDSISGGVAGRIFSLGSPAANGSTCGVR